MSDKELPKTEGEWYLQLHVHCPHCGEFQDILETDIDFLIDRATDFLQETDVECETFCDTCEKDFILIPKW